MKIRKTAAYLETVHAEDGRELGAPAVRAWAAAVLANPCLPPGELIAGEEAGALLGERLAGRLLDLLQLAPGTPLAYGKAAIVGAGGSTEHAAAILHPRLGAPVRRLIGQGRAVMPSTIKRGGPGTRIDIPLHAADDEWDFAALDGLEAGVPDAPLAGEIVVFVALASGKRPGAVAGS